ncbi:unnamed protein product, partial [Polarella glacialis]
MWWSSPDGVQPDVALKIGSLSCFCYCGAPPERSALADRSDFGVDRSLGWEDSDDSDDRWAASQPEVRRGRSQVSTR